LIKSDNVGDHITLGDLGEAIRYLKIESAASGVRSYRLAKLAQPKPTGDPTGSSAGLFVAG